MRISCQTRHIICFVINLIIYLIINRNIYIYIVICICAMSSSAPENIKIWCANGDRNRRFVWKQRQAPIAFDSAGVNPPTAPGGARASAAQPFPFLLFHHKFRKPDFSGSKQGYRASLAWVSAWVEELWRVRVSCCVCVCVAFRGSQWRCESVCVCVCCILWG